MKSKQLKLPLDMPYKDTQLERKSLQRKSLLQELIANGEVSTRREAAEYLGISIFTVYQYIRDLKINWPARRSQPPRPSRIRSENPLVPALRALLEQRQVRTLQEAANIVGVTRERVRQLINKHHLPRPYKKPTTRECKECPNQVNILGNKSGVCNTCRQSGRYHPTKKACVYGHPKIPENIYISVRKGYRHKTYRCKACSKIRVRAWLTKRQARIKSGELVLKPSSEFCVHGHVFVLDPQFAKNGHIRCAECQRIYYQKRFGNRLTHQGVAYEIIREDQLMEDQLTEGQND